MPDRSQQTRQVVTAAPSPDRNEVETTIFSIEKNEIVQIKVNYVILNYFDFPITTSTQTAGSVSLLETWTAIIDICFGSTVQFDYFTASFKFHIIINI